MGAFRARDRGSNPLRSIALARPRTIARRTACDDLRGRAPRGASRGADETPSRAQYEDLERTPSTTTGRPFDAWNAAKEQARLETLSPGASSDRHRNDVCPEPDEVDLPERKDRETLTPRQRWYYEHRSLAIERANRRVAELVRLFHELNRDEFVCADCGDGDPARTEFHHPNDDETEAVGRMVHDGYGRDRIRAEIANCVLPCVTCHARRHYEPPAPADGS